MRDCQCESARAYAKRPASNAFEPHARAAQIDEIAAELRGDARGVLAFGAEREERSRVVRAEIARRRGGQQHGALLGEDHAQRIDIALRQRMAFGAEQDETRARIGELRRDPVGVVALLGVAVEREAGEDVFGEAGRGLMTRIDGTLRMWVACTF